MTDTDSEKRLSDAFKQYRRSQIAELRPYVVGEELAQVSISKVDFESGSPKLGDMIARNPKNHDDQWLVAAKYFADNFEPVERLTTSGGNVEERAREIAEGKFGLWHWAHLPSAVREMIISSITQALSQSPPHACCEGMREKVIEECARRAANSLYGSDCESCGFMDMETGEIPCSMENDCGHCICGERLEEAAEAAKRIRALNPQQPSDTPEAFGVHEGEK